MKYMLKDRIDEDVEAVRRWLAQAGIKAENVPSEGAYVVKNHMTGKWFLVARRYIRDSKGHRLLTRTRRGFQQTIEVTVEVPQPPSFLLREGN